jgi:tripartite-type tricarboxylate transporter receptor subunit TctC
MLNVSRRLKFPQSWLSRLAVNVGVIGLLVSTLTGAQAFAQSAFKPTGPVKIVVMFPPGGGTDAVARIVGERLTDLWQQQVIIENKAGAQGNIGTAYASKATPDGQTLMIAHQGVMTVNPHLYKDMGFDVRKDIVPVGRLTQQPFVLVAHPSVPANTLKELEALAKSQPGKLSYGSSAAGPQLAVELFKFITGADLLHVAYKGAGPAVIDVLAGNINLLVANPTSVAPALTPVAVIAQLNKDVNAVLAEASVQKRISALGLNASPSTPAEFLEQINRDYARWGSLIQKAGIRFE